MSAAGGAAGRVSRRPGRALPRREASSGTERRPYYRYGTCNKKKKVESVNFSSIETVSVNTNYFSAANFLGFMTNVSVAVTFCRSGTGTVILLVFFSFTFYNKFNETCQFFPCKKAYYKGKIFSKI
jgi:hypothetical protein